MSILIKGIPLGGYEISIMKDGERYRARVDGIWCEVEEIPTTDADSDTISRAKAIEALDKRFDSIPMEQTSEILMLRKDLRDLPPAQPKKGKWIDTRANEEWYAREYRCSECGDTMLGEANFCPNCGADMREVTEC